MPELPEVETIVKDLTGVLIGKTISKVAQYREGTFTGLGYTQLIGESIYSITRRGKFIIIDMKSYKAVVQLRMTGKLIYSKIATDKLTHLRAEFKFTDNSYLYFDDIRTFGKIEVLKQNERSDSLIKLGIEPLSSGFTPKYLKKSFTNKKAPVKNLLLNQSLIAGIGNIYACEALYDANISPLKSGNELTDYELSDLVSSIKKILKKAIKYNGTTISDFRRIDDKTGEFQNMLRVYQKKECSCGNTVKRIKQAGRSTYYCDNCQK